MYLDHEAGKKINPELVQNLLQEYSGHLLDLKSLSDYDQASMTYFTDQKTTRQPRLSISFPLDVTRIHSTFTKMTKISGTFTGYLTWGLLATMRLHPHLSWRFMNGMWYEFDDLPLFIPVATALPGNRFVSVTLEHIMAADWASFSSIYKSAIEKARQNWSTPFGDQLHWSNYHFVGNLPQIQFTSFTLHESGIETARPIFYFGRRYENQGSLFVPFAVQFHHATFDPVRLSNFIADFHKILTNEESMNALRC